MEIADFVGEAIIRTFYNYSVTVWTCRHLENVSVEPFEGRVRNVSSNLFVSYVWKLMVGETKKLRQ